MGPLLSGSPPPRALGDPQSPLPPPSLRLRSGLGSGGSGSDASLSFAAPPAWLWLGPRGSPTQGGPTGTAHLSPESLLLSLAEPP